MPQLFVVAALAGVLTVFFDVAYQSYLPSLVERDQILEGNSKLTLSSTIAEVAGPGITGILVQLITAPIAILFDAISFLFSALSVALIRKPEPAAGPREPQHLVTETLAGIRFIFGHPVLRAFGLRFATQFFFMGLIWPLYILFAMNVLKIKPAVMGIAIGMGGVGATLGALLAPRVVRWLGLGRTFLVSSIVAGAATLFMPLAGVLPGPPVMPLVVQQLFGDLAFSIYFISEISLRQTIAPPEMLGRVNAGMNIISRGVLPIGALAGGYLAAGIGIRGTLVLAGVGGLLSTGWLLVEAVRRLK
jgi:Na+/melibiose symporter-like transporter